MSAEIQVTGVPVWSGSRCSFLQPQIAATKTKSENIFVVIFMLKEFIVKHEVQRMRMQLILTGKIPRLDHVRKALLVGDAHSEFPGEGKFIANVQIEAQGFYSIYISSRVQDSA